METYNIYLTGVAQEQSSGAALPVYKVRMPLDGEEVVGYTNSDCLSHETPTERSAREANEC